MLDNNRQVFAAAIWDPPNVLIMNSIQVISKGMHWSQVQAFYQQMGGIMAQRCDELGSSQGSSRPPHNSRPAKPASAAVPLNSQASVSQQQPACQIEEVT